jgi:hypothetical protein
MALVKDEDEFKNTPAGGSDEVEAHLDVPARVILLWTTAMRWPHSIRLHIYGEAFGVALHDSI